MVTAGQQRSQVVIAGVPWPAYKVHALLIAALTLLVALLVTASPAVAVLTAAGSGTAVWLIAGALRGR